MLEAARTTRLSSSDLYIQYYPILLSHITNSAFKKPFCYQSSNNYIPFLNFLPSCAGYPSSHISANGAARPTTQDTARSSVPQLPSPVRNGQNAAVLLRILTCPKWLAIAVIPTVRARSEASIKERVVDCVPWTWPTEEATSRSLIDSIVE